jgi:ParB family chromosome partitioning protein
LVSPLTNEEQASQDALQTEYNLIEENYGGVDDMPEDIAQRLAELEAALAAFEDRPVAYDPADIIRAGAFVSIDPAGVLRIERGFVRPEDEPVVQVPDTDQEGYSSTAEPAAAAVITVPQVTGAAVPPDEDEGLKPLPDRLVTELTVHRTLALRDALADDPDTAFLAVLHNFCLKTFYHYADESCLEIDIKSVAFITQAPGLADSISAKAIDARHQNWRQQLPEDPSQLWDVLAGFDSDSKVTLFAHCAALTVNAVVELWNRRSGRLVHVDHIAHRVGLDMVAAGWTPSVDNYLGRVTKARILETVREAKGIEAAQRIDHLKKPDMAKEAEILLQGSGWLPEILRLSPPWDETLDQPEIHVQAAE